VRNEPNPKDLPNFQPGFFPNEPNADVPTTVLGLGGHRPKRNEPNSIGQANHQAPANLVDLREAINPRNLGGLAESATHHSVLEYYRSRDGVIIRLSPGSDRIGSAWEGIAESRTTVWTQDQVGRR